MCEDLHVERYRSHSAQICKGGERKYVHSARHHTEKNGEENEVEAPFGSVVIVLKAEARGDS